MKEQGDGQLNKLTITDLQKLKQCGKIKSTLRKI